MVFPDMMSQCPRETPDLVQQPMRFQYQSLVERLYKHYMVLSIDTFPFGDTESVILEWEGERSNDF